MSRPGRPSPDPGSEGAVRTATPSTTALHLDGHALPAAEVRPPGRSPHAPSAPTRSAPFCWRARPRRGWTRVARARRQTSAPPVILGPETGQHGSRALDELLAQVAIAAGADAQQFRPATARVLPRHQPDPGGEVPAAAE